MFETDTNWNFLCSNFLCPLQNWYFAVGLSVQNQCQVSLVPTKLFRRCNCDSGVGCFQNEFRSLSKQWHWECEVPRAYFKAFFMKSPWMVARCKPLFVCFPEYFKKLKKVAYILLQETACWQCFAFYQNCLLVCWNTKHCQQLTLNWDPL